jgi:hypothetical protein
MTKFSCGKGRQMVCDSNSAEGLDLLHFAAACAVARRQLKPMKGLKRTITTMMCRVHGLRSGPCWGQPVGRRLGTVMT